MTRTPSGTFVFQNLAPKFRPKATWALNAVIVVVSLIGLSSPVLFEQFALDPEAVRAGEWWRIVTSQLLHGSYIHLAANVYFGFSIGARVERFIGPWRLLAISAVSMLGTGLAVTFLGKVPMVGFSGVIYGWLASSARLPPDTALPGAAPLRPAAHGLPAAPGGEPLDLAAARHLAARARGRVRLRLRRGVRPRPGPGALRRGHPASGGSTRRTRTLFTRRSLPSTTANSKP
ncbi:MAG: rhomboid family intramembrane serine protease [Myxococcales bacterium]